MRTAVYALIFEGQQVYIGCAREPEKRLKQHRATRPEGDAITIEVLSWHGDRYEALNRECDLIRQHLPPWNGTYAAKVARKAARVAKEIAEWQALTAKNQAAMDAANAEYEAAMRNE